jgi:small subunit ribosomal protein S2
VQLYARAAADAVLEGKAAAPSAAVVREDEFAEGGESKPARRAPAKKAAQPAEDKGAEQAKSEDKAGDAAKAEAAE